MGDTNIESVPWSEVACCRVLDIKTHVLLFAWFGAKPSLHELTITKKELDRAGSFCRAVVDLLHANDLMDSYRVIRNKLEQFISCFKHVQTQEVYLVFYVEELSQKHMEDDFAQERLREARGPHLARILRDVRAKVRPEQKPITRKQEKKEEKKRREDFRAQLKQEQLILSKRNFAGLTKHLKAQLRALSHDDAACYLSGGPMTTCEVLREAFNRKWNLKESVDTLCHQLREDMPPAKWFGQATRVALTKREIDHLSAYQIADYAGMNEDLRSDPPKHAILNTIIQKMPPLPDNITVYRSVAVSSDFFLQPRLGVQVFDGYLSTSLRSTFVVDFKEGCSDDEGCSDEEGEGCEVSKNIRLLRIRVPAGSRCIPVAAFTEGLEEDELLFPHPQVLIVKRISVEPFLCSHFDCLRSELQPKEFIVYDVDLVNDLTRLSFAQEEKQEEEEEEEEEEEKKKRRKKKRKKKRRGSVRNDIRADSFRDLALDCWSLTVDVAPESETFHRFVELLDIKPDV